MVFQILVAEAHIKACPSSHCVFPKVLSIAQSFSVLEGNVEAQEEMLKWRGCNLINGPAGRNILQNSI
ncbi:hypothetical protein MKX01_001149 [Papaver californicum]|nr:hypothetical protein MKX01_001149 [Papaver californicum]